MPKKDTSKSHKKTHKKYLRNFFIAFFACLPTFLILNQFTDLNPTWSAPAVLKSENGELSLTLNNTKQKVRIGNDDVTSRVYNGSYIAQTWDIKGGDTVRVKLQNNMDQSTNLHFHGGHVSPKGNSDNVLLNIKPGEDFQYEYKLPENHPPGLYWYHPHLHGYTDMQVGGGMVGAIVVRGDIDELPGVKGVPERILVLTTQDKGNNVGRLVNNQINPTMYVRPFETLRLRLLNASNDDFYNIKIPGQDLHIISRDGNTLSAVENKESEVLSPGDRIEILFQAGPWGTYDVQSAKYEQGAFTYVEDNFMKIKVFGLPVVPRSLPKTLIPYDNFKDAKIDNTRVLTFSEGGTSTSTTFLIDGKKFNPEVINQIMTLGTTEEWKIINESSEVHPFHIHVNPFQVVSINGVDINRKSMDDTFPIPANGEVTIRTKYRNFDGKYVLHCHILFHEDNGMMQLVEVVKPGNSTSKDNGIPAREEMSEMDHGDDSMNHSGHSTN
ncbi:MAG: multicopper oxidase family protein [Candidatus Levybacteria bacterium]|nr:multicopper oxidase family protein [Candidatus Levybacteria bacterium]